MLAIFGLGNKFISMSENGECYRRFKLSVDAVNRRGIVMVDSCWRFESGAERRTP